MTITQKLQKMGDKFVVVIPEEEMKRLGFLEGQPLAIESTPLESQPALRPVLKREIRAAIKETWDEDQEAYRYLAEH